MSAVPISPLSPGRRVADIARSPALRVVLGAGALAAISLVLARRVDLSSLAQADVVWGWIIVSLLLNLASVAGKAIVWKAALDALPGQRPVRYGHVVPALFIGFLLNSVLFARVGELARVAVLARRRRLAGESIPASTIAGTALAEQLVLGVALALAVVALAPVMHLPTLIWELRDRLHARARRGRRRSPDRDAQGARPLRTGDLRALARPGALLAAARHGRRDAGGDVLVGRADRRHLGGARGLRHPRRARRRRTRLRLVDDRAAVPLLARQPRHLPARRERTAHQRLRNLDHERRRLQRRPAGRRGPPRRRSRPGVPGPRRPLAERRPRARDGRETTHRPSSPDASARPTVSRSREA